MYRDYNAELSEYISKEEYLQFIANDYWHRYRHYILDDFNTNIEAYEELY